MTATGFGRSMIAVMELSSCDLQVQRSSVIKVLHLYTLRRHCSILTVFGLRTACCEQVTCCDRASRPKATCHALLGLENCCIPVDLFVALKLAELCCMPVAGGLDI